MRDFKAGRDINVNGDVVINDHSQYKPLSQCSNEDLKTERTHRQKVLSEERARKKDQIWNYLLLSALFAGAISIWYYFAGEAQFAMFIVGLFGILLPVVVAMKTATEQTEFETRQLEALKEIYYLLKERGIE